MSDFLLNLAKQPMAAKLLKGVGLPTPPQLKREQGPYADQILDDRLIALGTGPNGKAAAEVLKVLNGAGADVVEGAPTTGEDAARLNGAVFDGTGIATGDDLKSLYDFFHPIMRQFAGGARIVVLAPLPETAKGAVAIASARAVEGFVRSLAKEVGKKGCTANLLYVEKGAEKRLAMPLRFLLSGRSAFVDGQPIRITKATKAPRSNPLTAPLAGKVALVTGAARGIGAATANRLSEEGATVVCLDIPQDVETLNQTAASLGGEALAVDITSADAPATIAKYLQDKHGGVDIIIHNAGITRDKTLANMKEALWDMVLAVNFKAIMAIDEKLLADGLINDGGRVVCLSSIGGIAGNMGQTNYGTTKAGLIGYVKARGEEQAENGICYNAAAPGFIETRMTAEMPMMIREAGRRMCSLSQGGQPQDVAELITFLSTPGAMGVNGNVIRVCGQSLIGA